MERLQRILAARGVASRRAAEEMITSGRVQVNGVTVTELGTKADPVRAVIHVDGKLIKAQRPRYLILNKPSGYITTMKDERDRRTVMELVTVPERVYPVGRLDRDTEGLLILTNDGDVANRVMHPRYELDKEYHVLTLDRPTDQTLQRLRDGVVVEGKRIVPAEVRILRETSEGLILTVVVHEGIFHLVRRMMDTVGIPVERLRRVRVGPLSIAGIPLGTWRELTEGELRTLLEALKLDEADEESGYDLRTTRVRSARRPGERVQRGGSNPYARKPADRTDRTRPHDDREAGRQDAGGDAEERQQWRDRDTHVRRNQRASEERRQPTASRSERDERPRRDDRRGGPTRPPRSDRDSGGGERFEQRDRDHDRTPQRSDRFEPRDQDRDRKDAPPAGGGGRGRRYYDAPRGRRGNRDADPPGGTQGRVDEGRPPRDRAREDDKPGRGRPDRGPQRGPVRGGTSGSRTSYPQDKPRNDERNRSEQGWQERDRDERRSSRGDKGERPSSGDRDRRPSRGREDDSRKGPRGPRGRDFS